MIRLGMCNELFEGWDFAEVCSTLKGLGYEGIEIAPFTLRREHRRNRPPGVERSSGESSRIAGLATIGTHWLLAKTDGYYLTHPDAEVRRRRATTWSPSPR